MSRLPTKPEILDWIAANPTLTAKRDIAKAFGIKGAARIDLKRLLKELEHEGHLEKRKKTYRDPDRLPPVSVLQVKAPDENGDLFAKPLEWHGEGVEPIVLLMPRASDPALGEGDRILARLTVVHEVDHNYEARLIRRIGTNPRRILGIFRKGSEGGRIAPIDERTARRLAHRHPPARHPRRFPRQRRRRGRQPEARRPQWPHGPARPAAHHHRPKRCPRPRRRGLCPCRRRGRQPRRAHHLGRHRRRRPLCPPRLRARPRGAQAGQFELFPGPRRADAARPAFGRSLLAARGRAAGLYRGAHAGHRRGRAEIEKVRARAHALARIAELRGGAGGHRRASE
jgi:hypothetical protein